MIDTAHCHCSPIHEKYRDTPRYYDVDYPLLRALRMLPAHNNHLISMCKQLGPACHHWNNNDVFAFPKRLMPECQVYGCINKAEEGTSKGKRSSQFQITNGTEFPHLLLGNLCTDIKPRMRSRPPRTVSQCQSQTCSAIAYFAILFDWYHTIYKSLISNNLHHVVVQSMLWC